MPEKSVAEILKEKRKKIQTVKSQTIAKIREKIGIKGMGIVDDLGNVTLEDLQDKGVLETIQERIETQRTRIRTRAGLKEPILPKFKPGAIREKVMPMAEAPPTPSPTTPEEVAGLRVQGQYTKKYEIREAIKKKRTA